MCGTCKAGVANFDILSVTLPGGTWQDARRQNGAGWMLVLALPQGYGTCQLHCFGWGGPREDAGMAGVRGGGGSPGTQETGYLPTGTEVFLYFRNWYDFTSRSGLRQAKKMHGPGCHPVPGKVGNWRTLPHVEEAAW